MPRKVFPFNFCFSPSELVKRSLSLVLASFLIFANLPFLLTQERASEFSIGNSVYSQLIMITTFFHCLFLNFSTVQYTYKSIPILSIQPSKFSKIECTHLASIWTKKQYYYHSRSLSRATCQLLPISPLTQGNHQLLTVWTHFCSLYKWKHTVYSLLCLAFCTQLYVCDSSILLCAIVVHLLLLLYSDLLCEYSIVY